jgi:DnaJ like chaperone protein
MGWWGKIIGGAFGFMLGGPLGALLGAALGHNLDRGLDALPDDSQPGPGRGNQQRVQTAFFTATFSVMGHISKADGQVSQAEIALAQSVMAQMDLTAEQKQIAIKLFNEGKQDNFPLEEVLQQFRVECVFRRNLIRMFIEILLAVAYADGVLHPEEKKLLLHICDQLKFSREEFRQLEDMIKAERHYSGRAGKNSGPTINDAYALLNIKPDATDAEVKKAYRRMMNQHHPDKLVSRGLPEEMMKLASQKTHEIKQAYDTIKEKRGF